MMHQEAQEMIPAEILVVDDIAANLKLLTDILTGQGYRVRPATGGQLALRSVAFRLPDLILLDVTMPDMNGYEVCQALKSEEKRRDIPVIFISALDATKDKVRGFAAGGVDFITKPFQAEEVLARVETHLALRRMQQQLEMQNAQLLQASAERIKAQQEREQLHARLLQAQKLESVGQLAAGIAHEINTPAQFISANVNFLSEAFAALSQLIGTLLELLASVKKGTVTEGQIKANEEILARLDWDYLKEEIPGALIQSAEGIQRVTSIVQAMKEFSHPGGKQKVNTDLNRIIETTITVSRNEWKYVATVTTDLDPALQPVPCLADEMGQVLLNLLVNAAHAIEHRLGRNPDGKKGKITLTTRQHDQYVEIGVNDTGAGIPEHIRDKIFDPFFTTKEVGKGTGQGLTIAYDVITNKHNGTIVFETETNVGTTFIIRLPRMQP
ncbi:MAG: Multi-sensor signal transduction histidine kinase [uncultured bacterium]|nr:MAG: Multi-sensor signal transduction histidine kinase [uncultured bacterium]